MVMGVVPVVAIPGLLENAGLRKGGVDLWKLRRFREQLDVPIKKIKPEWVSGIGRMPSGWRECSIHPYPVAVVLSVTHLERVSLLPLVDQASRTLTHPTARVRQMVTGPSELPRTGGQALVTDSRANGGRPSLAPAFRTVP